MATEAQISANRRNALRSTGPRTQAGRTRSAMNATMSGIYAKSEIIPGEDPAELEALKSRMYDSLQPSAEETPLVDELIGADWQFRRLRRAEADVWTMSITGDREANRKKGLPEDTNVYYRAIEDNKDTFERLYRLQASTARILNRSLETLLRLRKFDLLQAEAAQPLSPIDSVPAEIDETNPIPLDPTPETEPAPVDNDKTNPIPEPVTPAASPTGGETNPIAESFTGPLPPIPEPAPEAPAPVPHTGFRYYNGRRLPVAPPVAPPQRHR
jgi:hypothetical protein